MNLVKGVADLIRRSSGGQTGEGGSTTHGEKLSAPSPRICFGDFGEEATLTTLWQRFENAIDKDEKRKLLQEFLLQFVHTYQGWEPVQLEPASGLEEVIIGCSTGHPSEVILTLIQETAWITSLVTEMNNGAVQGSADISEPSYNLEVSYVLDCLSIIMRSLHNCRVFSYYGGVQKITALLKAAAVKLKTLAGTLAVDEPSYNATVERTKVLQKILVTVISIIFNFMELNSCPDKKNQSVDTDIHISSEDKSSEVPSSGPRRSVSEMRCLWQQKAIVLVMEAGGVNWLVELLRVIRRLNLKEQSTDRSLHFLTLATLKLALCENPRAQNHFRSIGGLEVLLDGLGLPSSNFSTSKSSHLSGDERSGIFQLQVLSLEVLREATFGNINNMQFLCENGRIHKFANSICWPVFLLQDFHRQRINSATCHSQSVNISSNDSSNQLCLLVPSILDKYDGPNLAEWNEYSIKLSRALCSFLLAPEDTKFEHGQASVGQSVLTISLTYWELSIRWIMKVMQTVFTCINSCAKESELPLHIRILANTLQHHIICAFRKILVSASSLLNVFRDEGIWELIFSEKFFYFGISLEEHNMVITKSVDSTSVGHKTSANNDNHHLGQFEVDILQVEAVSFLEFVATLCGNINNVPECSILLDTLEQSASNPAIASILLKSLHRILDLAVHQTLVSFKSLDAIARVLKIACIQTQELENFKKLHNHTTDSLDAEPSNIEISKLASIEDAINNWVKCIGASFALFTDYLRVAEDGKRLVLHNSGCIESLFTLFWEENLQKHVLEHILALLKLPPSTPEDHAATLHLCCKYLETFTHAKEREQIFAKLSIDLLISIREIVVVDRVYYQNLFCDGECFLHIVSLLNGSFDEKIGEELVLNVLQTLTSLLTGNDDSKDAFRSLVGVGYQTLQSLLLDFCKWQPSKELLYALLDMLVDGKFDLKYNSVIKNEDVIILFLNVLQKSSNSLQQFGLDALHSLLKDSIPNRTACCRAGMLSFLLDWFPTEEKDDMIAQIAQLIQIVGGHSISGKDIRKIFALLRSDKVGSMQNHSSLLLSSLRYMLKEKGPEAFFEFRGTTDSGIIVNTPFQWPYNKGFSFSCWLRVEDFPENGVMGLFSFLTDTGKGCLAMIGRETLFFETINQKRQSVVLPLSVIRKKWHFLCVTHSIGRAFSAGSQLRCYVDGDLLSSEKCRYPKVSEAISNCSIGTELKFIDGDPFQFSGKISSFSGQIGPLYVFNDALTAEQIKGIHSLGPSYMYSFSGDEILLASCKSPYNGILDSRDGLSTKIVFGLNAQASDGRTLFNVSSVESSLDKNIFQAVVLEGTKLCSRRLLQEIIYCVGGVSVFFPLLTQFDRYQEEDRPTNYALVRSVRSDKLAAEIIDLVAAVLDGNASNQQQMHLLSGFAILGFLLQSVPPQQINAETLSALKYMFYVLKNSGMSEILLKDSILRIYLNPHIWLYANYEVQRDLYMFLIQYFESDGSLLPQLCEFPRIVDMICQFYWDKSGISSVGDKPLLHAVSKQVLGDRPCLEEVHKIRLLLLSLAEMSLRQKVSPSDIKALVAFFEKSHDMACIEDVLHMVIRALSQKPFLSSFLEQTNLLGGCHIFVNLLQRELEPIRLLGLQFLGKLLVGVPSEKKGMKFFILSVGRSKSISEGLRKGETLRPEPIFVAISERLFKFPLSDHLCATLFDVLLGGASPKQVLQKHNQVDSQKNKKPAGSQFSLPQILVCIFKYLGTCQDSLTRVKVMTDLLDLLDSNPLNVEALMEHGWTFWLNTSVKMNALINYGVSKSQADTSNYNEIILIRNMYCIVLSHYIYAVKGGWQLLEETINFILVNFEQGVLADPSLLRDIFEDLICNLVEISSEDNTFTSQPCRDNTLYLLKLVNELLINETGNELLFPGIGQSSSISSDNTLPENHNEISSAVMEVLRVNEHDDEAVSIPWPCKSIFEVDYSSKTEWWSLYEKTWILINALNGKGPNKLLPKVSVTVGPSFGQRARGLVESLNVPAAEMAAVVVSGGISNALGGKANKFVDKAILLRGERCPRIIFHLVILYICKASLETASRCVQHFIFLLPALLTSDDDQNKNRLHFFIWSLLAIRSKYGMLDDGARFHIITHLILEVVNSAKTLLATSILGRDDPIEISSNTKEAGFILSLIQRDRVLAAAIDDAKYIKSANADRFRQLVDLRGKLDEQSSVEIIHRKEFEEEIEMNMNGILSSDENRKASFRLAHDEDQQAVADKWIHMFRSLIDERGPWSTNPFPNNTIKHWKLDKTEDGWRRRPKLRRNYRFDERLCYPPTNKSGKETNRPGGDTSVTTEANIPQQMKHFLLKGVRGITEERFANSDNVNEPNLSQDSSTDISDLNKFRDSSDQMNFNQEEASVSSGDSDARLSVLSILITPKRKMAGRLDVLQNMLHFSGEFLVEGTAGASIFKSCEELRNSDSARSERLGEAQKNLLHKGLKLLDSDRGKGFSGGNRDSDILFQSKPDKIKRHRRWQLSKIKAVHWTRYLLQFTAVEIFFNDSTAPIFLNFSSQSEAKKVGTLIVTLRNEALFPKGNSRDRSGIISFIDRRVALEMAEDARDRWRRREISNFEYLMILNTLGGRSYNDLTQYPVFPWVLADYSSEKLDFNKSSTFRDLSKPVGALESKRFQVFEDRYRSFSDPDIPSFYYGSHYSSMGIVLYYLLRLEPFTALHRNLQGGKFDHADRLFQSIEGTYRNCMTNTSDVKELIPEFFYMPEFLVNSNSYHLGVKQDGEPLVDVSLPPWAKGSPEEFICRNREALETEYVSSNLHLWIDLIFGYKQLGKPAVEAANVFYYLTYEGAVDLENMDDMLQKSAIEDQIANFGQTPIQIFRKKHPRRGPPIPIAHPLHFAPASITLTSIVSQTSTPPSAVLFVGLLDNNIVLVNEGLTLSVKLWLTTQFQAGGNYTFSGSQEPFFGIGSDVLPPRKIGSHLAEYSGFGRQCLGILQVLNENYLVSCGNWENSFQVISLNDGRIVQSIRQHKDVVSCIAVSSDGSILVTGSYDTTVMVWHAHRARATEKKSRNFQSELPRKDHVIIETPFHILCGHDDIITCLFVSAELDIVISGSKDGTCIFHTLREGKYVRSIRHPSGSALSSLVVSQHGKLVIYAENDLSLHMYSINGKHVASSDCNGRLNCIELSRSGDFLVCAGDQGHITLRSMHSLDVVRKYEGVGKIITALAVTMEECFLAGTKDGSLLVYSIENPRTSRNSKVKVSAVG